MDQDRPEPVLVLKPQGPLDADSCGELRHQLAAAFGVGVRTVGIDLTGVPAIDQTGIGLLQGAARHLRRRGGSLTITRATPAVATTLRIHDLEDLLQPVAPVLRVLPGSGSGGPRQRPRRLTAVDALKQPG